MTEQARSQLSTRHSQLNEVDAVTDRSEKQHNPAGEEMNRSHKHQVAEASAQYLAQTAGTATPASHDCPPGYKRTEVGVIPEDWEIDSIGNLLSITTGNKNTQDRVDDGIYPFFVRSQTVERINSYSFDGEGVLTAGDGVGTGKIFHYINGKFDFHQRVYLIYNFGEKIDGYYFYIYFSNKFYDRIMSMTAKSSVDSVRREMIADMKVVLPPQKEQTAIANALSDVDALISELEKLIAKKQAIKTATMQQLLTGRTRLPQFALREDGTPKGYKQSELGEIPEDWEVERFSNLAKPSLNRVNPRIYGGGDFCVELENFSQGEGRLCGYSETTSESSLKNVFEPGDVLFGKLRSYLRKYWLADVSGVCSTEIWVLKPNRKKTFSAYIYYQVQTDRFVEAASEAYGTHMPRADWNVIEGLAIAIPSLEEQTAIATILSDMDEEIQALQQRLAKTHQIKQGMMQELLTGKTRLVKSVYKESQHG